MSTTASPCCACAALHAAIASAERRACSAIMAASPAASESGQALAMRTRHLPARCCCQRRAVCQLPLLAPRNAGLTITSCGLLEPSVIAPGPLMNTALSEAARRGGRQLLTAALCDSRARTLALLDAYAVALGDSLVVPYSPQINPPRWEAGHVGWFQDYWIARNRQRARGIACDPDHERPAGRLPQADALYDSSRVAHATRWQLDLPDLAATRAYLAEGLAETLALLAATPETDDGALLLPPGAVPRRHARRSRHLHGAGARHSAARIAARAGNCRAAGSASARVSRAELDAGLGRRRVRLRQRARPARGGLARPRNRFRSGQLATLPALRRARRRCAAALPAPAGRPVAAARLRAVASPARSMRRQRISPGAKPTPGAAGPAAACRAKRSGRWRP